MVEACETKLQEVRCYAVQNVDIRQEVRHEACGREYRECTYRESVREGVRTWEKNERERRVINVADYEAVAQRFGSWQTT